MRKLLEDFARKLHHMIARKELEKIEAFNAYFMKCAREKIDLERKLQEANNKIERLHNELNTFKNTVSLAG